MMSFRLRRNILKVIAIISVVQLPVQLYAVFIKMEQLM